MRSQNFDGTFSHPDLLEGERPKTVGVVPAIVFDGRRRLWRCLEEAFPVRFEPRNPDQLGALDAVIAHCVDVKPATAMVVLRTYAEERTEKQEHSLIRFPSAPKLDRALRGRALDEAGAEGAPPIRLGGGETAMAECDGSVMWSASESGDVEHRSAILAAELGDEEVLRDRLRAGRFFALLPIVTLLRELTEDLRWTAPPLRAAFVFDDPNLHWTSYGRLDFKDLAIAAERERFHVAIATVPLDGWWAHGGCVRLFKHNSDQLSLLVHGNEHSWCELGEARTDEAALAIVAQAVRRVQSFERRTGIAVSRVMAPPHGRCSVEVFGALRRTGFLAACISRPYPWLERPPRDCALAQWEIADMVAGLPVLPRYSLNMSRDDIPLRAFLGQPLILYGHHNDLAGGGGLLEEAAAEINRIGEVRWQDLASIAKSSFLTRRDGDLLRVRMHTREADLEVPAGVRWLAVELASDREALASSESIVLTSNGSSRHVAQLSERVAVDGVRWGDGSRGDDAGCSLKIRLSSADAVSVEDVRAPRLRLWPRARRVLVEGRDRLTPVIGRTAADGRRFGRQPLQDVESLTMRSTNDSPGDSSVVDTPTTRTTRHSKVR